MKSPEELTAAIAEQVNMCDEQGLTIVCNELMAHLFSTNAPFPPGEAERILFLLRSGGYFTLMQKVGDAFIQTGRGTFVVFRQYAQALIEQENYHLAIFLLTDLVEKTGQFPDEKARQENAEARGLLGRVYKQLFAKSIKPVNPFTLLYFNKAIAFYKDVYYEDPKENTWHGINTASMLYLARKEHLDTMGMPGPEEIATDILDVIIQKQLDKKVNGWDYATAAEASLILGKWADAERYTINYLADPATDLFAVRSTLRQFTEVLQLEAEPGARGVIDALKQGLQRVARFKDTSTGFERAFTDARYIHKGWLEDALARGRAVARIGLDRHNGEGTGFLIRGSRISEKLGNDYVLLTNAHVVSDDEEVLKKTKALRFGSVCVTFEIEAPQEEFCLCSVYWTSGPYKLDVSILQFAPEQQSRINEIGEKAEPFPIARALPILPDPTQKINIIGHPGGKTLEYSVDDNQLLDHEKPRIHYRTRTDPGSSGSPIFNRKWDLLGIHHKGSERMQKLNGEPGFYEANEGIYINSIKDAVLAAGK